MKEGWGGGGQGKIGVGHKHFLCRVSLSSEEGGFYCFDRMSRISLVHMIHRLCAVESGEEQLKKSRGIAVQSEYLDVPLIFEFYIQKCFMLVPTCIQGTIRLLYYLLRLLFQCQDCSKHTNNNTYYKGATILVTFVGTLVPLPPPNVDNNDCKTPRSV